MGQTITLTHLAPFVDVSRKYITKELKTELDESGVSVTEDQLEKMVNKRLQKEISDGIQTIQYQILTLMTTNGQTPFVTVFMYLNEAEDEQTKHDLALIIEEMLRQRFKGVKNEVGVWISPAFPKLIYVIEDDNVQEGDKYFYLTKLASKVSAKRLVPDYISEKKIKELKEGDVFPSMGAAVGYETVSIMIDGVEHNNIKIEKAFSLIRDKLKHATKHEDTNNKPLTKCKNKCGVYKLIHKPTGLYYIGASTNIARRLAEHRYSFMHKGTLGDRYLIDDYNIENLCFELLEECSMDDLYKVKSKYVHFKTKDKLCVNQKDPINNGNFTSENHLAALQGKKYSTYVNGWAGTWVKEVPTYSNIFIKSCGEWVPIRNIIYNNEQCPLKLISVDYNKHGRRCSVQVTIDHPLETQRGRVQAKDIIVGDELIDALTGKHYEVMQLRWSKNGVRTYDFTTDNDMFDLSGIVSHNCRSFLSVDKTRNGWDNIAGALDYDPTKPKYYGRWNQGVCTINLPDVALSSHKDFDKFWDIFDERLELCHKALQCRHERLVNTPSDVAPILWQYGALARLKKGETIDKLLYNDYSTISLGYAGLYECVKYMTGESHTAKVGHDFAIKVMQHMNDKCNEWKAKENIGYSLYGTPQL